MYVIKCMVGSASAIVCIVLNMEMTTPNTSENIPLLLEFAVQRKTNATASID